MKRLRITVEGKTYDVTVEVLGDHPHPGSAILATPAAGPALAAPSPAAAHAHAHGEPVTVISQLAGTVVSVQVKVGQAVAAGEPLLIVEAMKMNTSVVAPRAGTIAAVAVEAGTVIEEGQVLVTLN